MRVRRAQFEDLPGIVACEAEFPAGIAWRIEQYIALECACFVVCEPVDGSLWYRENGARLEIVSVAVRSICQGQGYGRALIEHAHAWGRNQGLRKAFLDVHPNNPGARRLYERLGYRVVGRTGTGSLRMQVKL